MIDREFTGGPIVLRCDACAPEYCETGEKDFTAALAAAKRDGWTAKHMGGDRGWAQFCPDCVETRPWEREGAVRPRIGMGKR